MKKTKKPSAYFEAIGRRKTAVARVRLQAQGTGEFLTNGQPLEKYFPARALQQKARESLIKISPLDQFRVSVKVKGGGLHAQAEAIRHGIARALVKFDAGSRQMLKKAGFLTRDSRMRERKKFGLKRARRAPQWGKR
ncbi:MAG: 30S ribosomal protein S9 [Candidatus Nealsonbacteria bacterium RIFCSPLOWO2_01_FULL_43_32]|uniref:Small ribosomal subunit protein uS9 n=1 Tax=Candidatus Nealsonbacteria bacterium RIFCSPLOWO2_01_FULL_43_32 TaxID=1801672 RepID=A0A1G2EHB5_9BACT|nr:MAG: 30S ribosomal protein S9 [Candidatus Nealsonbacteria bacterium RIFCSPLOWO2_01_FULL_43_32]